MECLNICQRNIWPDWSSIPIQTKFDAAVDFGLGMYFLTDASTFLHFLGLDASDRRLVTLRSTGMGQSMLHHVAIRLIWSQWSDEAFQSWISLGVEVMKNGADTCCLTAETGINHGMNWHEGPITPLLGLIGVRQWQVPNERCELERMQKKIQSWADMVRQAGIDLCQYGAREAQVWKTLPGYESPCRWLGASYLRVLQPLFGATPADWSLEVQGRPLESGILELRNPPGSFPRDQRVPTKIFWRPTTEEMDEGIWKTVAAFTISPRSMKLEDAITILVEEETPFFKMIEDTQDDAGAISLLSLRANRTSRSWRTSASRSNSQPASLLRANSIKHKVDALSGLPLYRRWLPACHFCPFDSKWSMGCDGNRHAWPEAPDDDLERFRTCIQGRKDRRASVQESTRWEQHSFLAYIARCQDCLPQDYVYHYLNMYGHNTGRECPQKCRMVNLKQLHVPRELRPYHPSLIEPE